MSEEVAADPGAYFDERTRQGADPWNDPDSWYETRKRSVLLATLLRPRYDVAWEPACGGGRLSVELAPRCGRLYASDASPLAVAAARAATAHLPSVEVAEASATTEPGPPAGSVDLVVLSEFLYYLPPPDQRRVLDLAARLATTDGEIVLASWRHASHDTFGTGEAVTDAAGEVLATHGFRSVARHTEDDFVVLGLSRSAQTS